MSDVILWVVTLGMGLVLQILSPTKFTVYAPLNFELHYGTAPLLEN